mmetsp:Transcript_12112/g.18038  ORF Transcript_12112/g.18038 Transcript_12112/m.18038 type:complete len:409 (+) Transcript_12112:98-1324(+)
MTTVSKTNSGNTKITISSKPSYKSKITIKTKNKNKDEPEFKEVIRKDVELEEMSSEKADVIQEKELVVIQSSRSKRSRVCCLFNINSDIFPFSNIFMFCFSMFLLIYAADGFFNFECFYGRDHQSTLKSFFNQAYNYAIPDIAAMIIVYVHSSILSIIALLLLFSLVIKIFRWIGFLRGTGYFSKHSVIQKLAESFSISLIIIYGTCLSGLLGVLGLFETRSYVDLLVHIVILSIFYMKATKWVTVLLLPLFWLQHHLITLLEVVPYVGMDRRQEYIELFSKICFKSGLAETAYYAMKSFEGLCALTFLIGLLFLMFGICIGVMAKIGCDLVLWGLKLTFIKYMIVMCAGILFNKYSITVIAQQYVLMAFIGGLIYTAYPETNFAWFFTHRMRRDIQTKSKKEVSSKA